MSNKEEEKRKIKRKLDESIARTIYYLYRAAEVAPDKESEMQVRELIERVRRFKLMVDEDFWKVRKEEGRSEKREESEGSERSEGDLETKVETP